MTSIPEPNSEDRDFVEFRRKVRSAEVLSAALERLLRSLQFSGRVSVIVQNGKVLKSGYEEGFFTHRGRHSHKTLDARLCGTGGEQRPHN